MGLGLWNNAALTFALEAIFLITALWIYLRDSRASSSLGKYGMAIFVVLLISMNLYNIFGPAPQGGKVELVVLALSAYFLFATAAFWLDTKRH